jgi:hypothetical protein
MGIRPASTRAPLYDYVSLTSASLVLLARHLYPKTQTKEGYLG